MCFSFLHNFVRGQKIILCSCIQCVCVFFSENPKKSITNSFLYTFCYQQQYFN